MYPNNWRQPFPMEHPPMDDACEDWRSQLQADSRPRVVDKIMGTLRHCLPSSGHEGDEKLQKIATTFEENAYHAATDQIDYLRRISLEMLKMESKCDPPDPMLSKSVGMSGNSQDPGPASQSMQPQVQNQSQSISVMMASNQPTAQGRPQFMTQNIQININCAGIQSSAATLQPHMQQPTQQNNLLSSSQPSVQQYQQQLNSQTLMARMVPQQQQMVVTQSVDSTAQTGNSDAQEEVYQKLKVMKDLYFAEIHDIYQKICSKLLQHETRSSEQANSVAFDRLKVYKQVIERLLQLLQLSRSNAQHFAKDKLPSLEKQILQVVNTHRSRRPGSNLDPVQGNGVGSIQQNPASAPQQTNPQTGINLLQSSMNAQQPNSDMLRSQHLKQQQEQQLKQLHPNSRRITLHQPLPHNLQQQQMKDLNNIEMRQSMLPNSSRFAPSLLPGDPEKARFAMSKAANIVQQQTLNTPASLDSSAPTGYSDARDEVYQKLKDMKDLYFAGIHDIYQRVCLKLQQHTPSSQQAKLEAFGKLEVYKQMLERILQILQLSKHDAQHFHKDKLPSLEKQILQILHTHRPNSFSC